MKETERIEDQLKRAFHGESWHGPAVLEALSGVTAELAARRPVADAHTIWELVHHITAWAGIVLQGVQGEPVKVTPEVDWPAVTDKSEAAWNDSLKRMQDVESGLREHVLRIPESRLDEPRGEGRPTAYVLLHGVVQHSLYHAGQIVLLKKALRG